VHRAVEKLGEYFHVRGEICVVNSIDEFRSLDKNGVLRQFSRKLWENIVRAPQLSAEDLLAVYLLVFADLKAHTYTYW
jgi:hypothetical protein